MRRWRRARAGWWSEDAMGVSRELTKLLQVWTAVGMKGGELRVSGFGGWIDGSRSPVGVLVVGLWRDWIREVWGIA